MPSALASTSSQCGFWPYWTGSSSRTVDLDLLSDSTALGGNRGDRSNGERATGRQVDTKQHGGG